MTLVLQTNTPITSPIFPNVLEVDPDLAVLLRASSLIGLSEGDVVSSVVATGQAAARTRTFDAANTGWSLPMYSTARGQPSLRFDGTRQIKNWPTPLEAMDIPQPAAIFLRFRLDAFNYTSSTSARLMSAGTSTPTYITLRPGNVVGNFLLSTPNQTHTISTAMVAGQWGVIGLMLNGASTRFIDPSGNISARALDAIPVRGITIGGNFSTLSTGAPGLIGDLSEARVYTKAMTDAELLATWQAMAA